MSRSASVTPGTGKRRLAGACMSAALVLLVAGCGLLGGLSKQQLVPQSMAVASPGQEVSLAEQYTCHGAGMTPPLIWSGAPAKATKSFAIVIDDSQAPITPFVYWIVYNISKNSNAIPQNGLPPGAVLAQNSRGEAGYSPPCPQPGQRNMYRLTVYALDARLNLQQGAGLRKAWMAIASHVIDSGRLTLRGIP